MSSTKEITESLGFGLLFASIKAVVDYAGGKKPYNVLRRQNYAVIAAGADLVYDYGKSKKWWPWI